MSTLDGRAIWAGLTATVAMTAFMAALALAGFPHIDVAALIVEPVLGRQPSPWSGWWCLGLTAHLVAGALAFPFAFRVLQRRLPDRVRPILAGWALGFGLFLVGEGLLIPISGGGLFSSHSAQPGLTVLEDFLSHSLYGVLLGAMAGRT